MLQINNLSQVQRSRISKNMPTEKGAVKGKLTLYNFINLRSPQSTKAEEMDFRFIEVPKEAAMTECEKAALVKYGLRYEGSGDCAVDVSTTLIDFDALTAFINECAYESVDPKIEAARSHCRPDCKPTEREHNNRLFTNRARFIAEHKSDIDYIHLEQLDRTFKNNISSATAKVLFIELIRNFKGPKDFAVKENISDWLVFWNLLSRFTDLRAIVESEKAIQEAEDAEHHRDSFCKPGSKRKFRNEVAKKYIEQLLNATIILPTKEYPYGIDTSLLTEANGPIEKSLNSKGLISNATFHPPEELRRKHSIDLAILHLQAFPPADADELQLLQSKILENALFKRTYYFFAGSPVTVAPSSGTLGLVASVVEDTSANKFYLYITASEQIENGVAPIKVKVCIKRAETSNKYEPNPIDNNIYLVPSVLNGIWYVEIGEIPSINSDVENLFIELNYSGGITYIATIQLNKISGLGNKRFEGSGNLFDSPGLPFRARLLPPNTDIPDSSWKLSLDEIEWLKTEINWKEHLPTDPTDDSYDPIDIEMTLRDNFGTQNPDISAIEITPSGPIMLDLDKLRVNTTVPGHFRAFMTMRLSSGKNFYSLPFSIGWDGDDSGDGFLIYDEGKDAYGKTYVPTGFGITHLGVADYQRVVSHVVRYEAGEVAHIENLMGREYKEKVVTKEQISEVTDFDSLETETERLTDKTSNERFQMQTEIAKIQHEDNKTNVDAHASYNSGGGSASINYSNAASTSRDESNKQSVTIAKELTNRAMERIVSKVKTDRTVKVTDRLTDVTKQGFDNRGSSDHVSGVYRYINAIYKNEIENYGKRLAYEFSIPQPSKLHVLGMSSNLENGGLIGLDKPIDPRSISIDADPNKLFTWDQITERNYLPIARKYDAKVTLHPRKEREIQETFEMRDFSSSSEFSRTIKADPDYLFKSAQIEVQGRTVNGGPKGKITFLVGGTEFETTDVGTADGKQYTDKSLELTISQRETLVVQANHIHMSSINGSIRAKLELSNLADRLVDWQQEVYDQIFDAYEEKLREYNEKVASLKTDADDALESNPLNFRQIEQLILRMNCISYLIPPYEDTSFPNRNFGKKLYVTKDSNSPNSEFNSTRVNLSKDSGLDEYAAFVKFVEQAFEWNIMSYNFYPFYWAGYSEWANLYQYDCNDALFKSFMQAGMARVTVTVRPEFYDAVLLFMKTGKIWMGGHIPVYGDDLYISMANELKDPEYKVDGSWETVLPTNLLALQKGGAVVNTHGLPNLEKPVLDSDDEIEDEGSSLMPIIKNNESVVHDQANSVFHRIRFFFKSNK